MYIRTKDGMYKRREDTYIEDNILYQIGYDFGRICLGEVIKEADAIEELCDEFRELLPKYKGNDIIGYEHEKWEYSVSDKKFYNDIGEWCYVEDFIIRCYKVYGAIWTEKGLIYVAKMNDKGVLELI